MIVLILLTGIIATSYLVNNSQPTQQTTSNDNLDNHPIYSNYIFSSEPNVINIGTQPLLFPTGLITEAMKRDQILQEILNEKGISINFHPFLKGKDVNHFLSDGRIDAGVGGDTPTLSAIAAFDAKVPVAMQKGFVSIVSDRPISLKQLKGKTIGNATGSNAHYGLLSALNYMNMDTSDVQLVSMDTPEMIGALSSGKIDAFAAWEPTPSEALALHSSFYVVHQRTTSGFLYFRNDFYTERTIMVEALVAAVLRAVLWMQESDEHIIRATKWYKETTLKLSGIPLVLSDQEVIDLAQKDLLGKFTLPDIPMDDLKDGGILTKEF